MSTNTTPSVSELAAALQSAAPSLDDEEQRLVVGLYQELAKGDPVFPAELAVKLDVPADRIEDALDRWPGVYRDEDGAVIGFWGIALSGMPHHLEINGTASMAWCALDPFLIAPLLDVDTTEVQSEDPVTGEEITLTITPDGVVDVVPESTVISMLAPDGPFDHDVVQSFCHYVWFFASPESGEQWTAEHPGTFILTVDEANQVARRSWPALVQQALERRVA